MNHKVRIYLKNTEKTAKIFPQIKVLNAYYAFNRDSFSDWGSCLFGPDAKDSRCPIGVQSSVSRSLIGNAIGNIILTAAGSLYLEADEGNFRRELQICRKLGIVAE